MGLDKTRRDIPYLLGRLMGCWFEVERRVGEKRPYELLAKTQIELPLAMLARFNRSVTEHSKTYAIHGIDKIVDEITNFIDCDKIKNEVFVDEEQASWILGCWHQRHEILSQIAD